MCPLSEIRGAATPKISGGNHLNSSLSRAPVAFMLILLVLAAGGCDGRERDFKSGGTAAAEASSPAALPTIEVGGNKLNVEIVQDPETREKGLMNRQSLPEEQGMLFVFEVERVLYFWMRNTFIPLDIAFIDSKGKIVDIQTMAPLDETRQYVSAAPALYALEVNAGWFQRHKVRVGDSVAF